MCTNSRASRRTAIANAAAHIAAALAPGELRTEDEAVQAYAASFGGHPLAQILGLKPGPEGEAAVRAKHKYLEADNAAHAALNDLIQAVLRDDVRYRTEVDRLLAAVSVAEAAAEASENAEVLAQAAIERIAPLSQLTWATAPH